MEQQDIIRQSLGFLSKDSIVIDVGAYNGFVSHYLCTNSAGTPENYHLIEACPVNYSTLKNANSAFNLYHCAISDKTGHQVFYSGNHATSAGSSQANSLYKEFIMNKEWNAKTVETTVETYTMDDFIEKINANSIDYLKINCEGGEYKIFEASTAFLGIAKVVYIQLHGKDPIFLTPEYRDKRNRINRLFVEYGYGFSCGDHPDDVYDIDGHTQQLWVKNG